MKTNFLPLLLSGALLAGCQSNTNTETPTTPELPAMPGDSTTAPAATDTIAKIGSPKLLHTLDDAHNTPTA
ncbi:hypothetical protein [Hymenobacter volaticus]|uniref:Uncharacterized protein n=1 Tax=Hymenobacter volaticus TaxID=2932254 RepID=A0ABY4G0M0_9BACT|nr:hypothetical protein [Hymenobacter volaticus]UOQ64378.1 hypothetical protein MUN86_12335 [Hymenobacter volaticus]